MKDKRVIIGAVIILVLLIIAISRGGDSNQSSQNGDSGEVGATYSLSSSDGNTVGWAQTSQGAFDNLKVEWVMVITDGSIKNNGKCIDEVGTWCADDPDGQRAALSETKYHYGLTFTNTEDNESVAAGQLTPIYCNKDSVLADLGQFITKEYSERTDYRCKGALLANWQPTDSFIVIGVSQFESVEEFLSSDQLALYDIHATYTVKSEKTATSLTTTEGNTLSSNQYKDQPLVKNYSISIAQ